MPSDCAMWLDLACIRSILCQSSKCVLTKPLYKSLIFVFIKIFRDFHFLETSSYKFSKKVGLLTSKLPGSITILSSCILTQNCQLSLLRKIKFKLSLREVKYPVKKLAKTKIFLSLYLLSTSVSAILKARKELNANVSLLGKLSKYFGRKWLIKKVLPNLFPKKIG